MIITPSWMVSSPMVARKSFLVFLFNGCQGTGKCHIFLRLFLFGIFVVVLISIFVTHATLLWLVQSPRFVIRAKVISLALKCLGSFAIGRRDLLPGPLRILVFVGFIFLL